MIVYPAIDLRGGRCVRLRQGRPEAESVFADDPAVAARRWAAQGAEWLHVVNLDGALGETGHENLAALDRILAAVEIPVQFGGGLRSSEDALHLLDQGVSRVILARELSCGEIETIRRNTRCELEVFIHGSVCISLSGRCLISDYLAHRGANQGQCTQPCRWDYAMVERTRAGQYMPVGEEDGFTFLYNSKDLCLLPVFEKVMALGLDGLKIEGRNKASLYVATVVAVYRQARDEYLKEPEHFQVRPEWIDEIAKVSNRQYFTGFFTGKPGHDGINYDFKGYEQSHHLAARVVEVKDGHVTMEARNPLIEGMVLEWLSSTGQRQSFVLRGAFSEDGAQTHIKPNQLFSLKTSFVPKPGELIRKPFSEGDRVMPGREG